MTLAEIAAIAWQFDHLECVQCADAILQEMMFRGAGGPLHYRSPKLAGRQYPLGRGIFAKIFVQRPESNQNAVGVVGRIAAKRPNSAAGPAGALEAPKTHHAPLCAAAPGSPSTGSACS